MKKKSDEIHIRIAQDKKEALKEKASKCGLTLSGYISSLVDGYNPKEKPDKEFYVLMRQMSSVCNNINQLTAKANSLDFIDAPMLHKLNEEFNKTRNALFEKYIAPDKED